jgi:ligand-binding SRPBCC domain-containing protein
MKFTIHTHVKAPLETVKAGFDVHLLKAISPPLPRIRVQVYEGNKVGDKIDFLLHFGLFKGRWTGEVTERADGNDRFWFVDEGHQMPLGLKRWHHKHLLHANHSGTIITDEVTFATANKFTDMLLFLPMYLQFVYRKPWYKRYFRLNGQ